MGTESGSADPLIGALIDGRYQVNEVLGAGGMGVVYRAEHLQLHRPIALKVLQRALVGLAEVEKRFEREAQALAALAHPNIVTVLDYGWHDGAAYLAMELLSGHSLFDLVQDGPLPPARAIEIARQLLRGLAFAHARGILHRDLKPGNVFLHNVPDLGETVKILDFGLAKFLEPDKTDGAALTRAGAVYGTPAYMAPEQIAGEGADLRTDVYSAGVVLFELLAGRRPFEGTPDEMLRAHLLGEVPPLASLRPDLVPVPALEALVRRAMAKRPADRHRDACEMLEELERIPAPAATSTTRAPSSDAPTVAATGRRRRASPSGQRRVLTVAGLVVAGVVALIAVAVTWPGDEPTTHRAPEPAPALAPSAAPAPPGLAAPSPPSAAEEADVERGPLAGTLPPALAGVYERVQAGEALGNADLRPVYGWFVRHPDDVRALLLLGRAYARAGWNGDAVDRYRRAARLDDAAQQDPHMLDDLLSIVASDPEVSRRAAGAVEQIYGARAGAAVEQRLAGTTDPAERGRLERLRATLGPR